MFQNAELMAFVVLWVWLVVGVVVFLNPGGPDE